MAFKNHVSVCFGKWFPCFPPMFRCRTKRWNIFLICDSAQATLLIEHEIMSNWPNIKEPSERFSYKSSLAKFPGGTKMIIERVNSINQLRCISDGHWVNSSVSLQWVLFIWWMVQRGTRGNDSASMNNTEKKSHRHWFDWKPWWNSEVANCEVYSLKNIPVQCRWVYISESDIASILMEQKMWFQFLMSMNAMVSQGSAACL